MRSRRSFFAGMAAGAAILCPALSKAQFRIEDGRGGASGRPQIAPRAAEETGASGPFTIRPQIDPNESAQLEVQRWFDFERTVALRVRTDPALIATPRLMELVGSIGMVDGAGLRIERGFAIDAVHDLVVGFSGGTAEITAISRTPAGLTVTALMRDAQGRIVTPPASSLGVYTTGGERLCFEEEVRLESASAPLPMSFALLLDRSGSMAGVMDDVRRAARSFLNALPPTAHCAVGAFSDGYSFEPSEGFGGGACGSATFTMQGLRPEGGTNLFVPLKATYEWLASRGPNHQKAVIIITDGQVNGRLDLAAQAKAAKGDTVTFVYYLGQIDDTWLRGLADNYLRHEGDLRAALPRYFSVLSEAYRRQVVLRLKPCGPRAGGGRRP